MSQRRSTWRSLLLIGVMALSVVGCAPPAAPLAAAPATVAPTAIAPTIAANAPAAATSLPDTITVAEAAAKRDAGGFVLDVRTQDEWNIVHIPGATLIPLDQLPARINEVPKDKEVVVICHSGNRSKQGRDILKNAGYTQVTSVAGGMNEWQAAGLPTVAGP